MKIYISALLFFLAFTGLALADISLEATVDRNEASLDEIIVLSVTVSGTQSSPSPEIPQMNEFQVQSRGTSSSIQIINGQMTSSITHNYILAPKSAGEFVIPPVILQYKGQTYQSQPIRVKITKPGVAASGNEAVYITAEVSNTRPYIKEQVVYTFRLYQRTRIVSPQLQLPKFENFAREELGKQTEYQKTINGVPYNVTEIRLALFPSSSGKMTIEPAALQVGVPQETGRRRSADPFDRFFSDPFFGGNIAVQQKVLHSAPISMEVRPLPETGRAVNFRNLVGDLQLKADISRKELKKGETTTLTVRVTGDGNVNDVSLPEMSSTEFKVYDDKPEFKKNDGSGRIVGNKILKRSIVPVSVGDITIPAVEVQFFNTRTERYETLKAGPFQIKVLPGGEEEKFTATSAQTESGSGARVRLLAKDLMDIHTDLDAFSDRRFTRGLSYSYAALFFLPVIIYISTAIFIGRQRRLRDDVGFARRSRAYKHAIKRIAQISSADTKVFYAELSRGLRDYIGDKLNVQGGAFTPLEVEGILAVRGLDSGIIKDIRDVLERSEAAQYAMSAPGNDLETVRKEALGLISRIEKVL